MPASQGVVAEGQGGPVESGEAPLALPGLWQLAHAGRWWGSASRGGRHWPVQALLLSGAGDGSRLFITSLGSALSFPAYDACEQIFNVIHYLLKIKDYMLIFNSGNEKTEGILPQIRHGSAWRHQGGDLLCKATLRFPSEW